MSEAALQLVVGVGVFLSVTGLGGMVLRRSLLVVVMSGALALLGAVLILAAFAARGESRSVGLALTLLVVAAAWAVAGAATALATYRRRGTENVDELRELRG